MQQHNYENMIYHHEYIIDRHEYVIGLATRRSVSFIVIENETTIFWNSY